MSVHVATMHAPLPAGSTSTVADADDGCGCHMRSCPPSSGGHSGSFRSARTQREHVCVWTCVRVCEEMSIRDAAAAAAAAAVVVVWVVAVVAAIGGESRRRVVMTVGG